MGIINLTDNSFFGPSRVDFRKPEDVVERARKLFDDGADIIDVGACSTAPGNRVIAEDEEWRRLAMPLGALFEAFPKSVFSIDCFRPGIVRKVLKTKGNAEGLIINDVCAREMDEEMLRLVSDNNLGYVAVDSSDDPAGFFEWFSGRTERFMLDKVMFDPGFGFGKTMERNCEILNNLESIGHGAHPLLVALSHKRMIYSPLGLTAETCTSQSVAAEILAFEKGADIVRTHDVALLKSQIGDDIPMATVSA